MFPPYAFIKSTSTDAVTDMLDDVTLRSQMVTDVVVLDIGVLQYDRMTAPFVHVLVTAKGLYPAGTVSETLVLVASFAGTDTDDVVKTAFVIGSTIRSRTLTKSVGVVLSWMCRSPHISTSFSSHEIIGRPCIN